MKKALTEAERIGQEVGAIGGVLKPGSLTFLDQQRFNNIAIALKKVNLPNDVIRRAVLELDLGVLTPDVVALLEFAAPTADDAEALIIRTKSAADNATPSGNSVIAATLARLHFLTGADHYRQRAEERRGPFAAEASQNFFPPAGLFWANEVLQTCAQVVVVGDDDDPATSALLDVAWKAPNMNKLIQRIPPDVALPENHPAAGKGQQDGRATAYVCVGQTCSLPLIDPAALHDAL